MRVKRLAFLMLPLYAAFAVPAIVIATTVLPATPDAAMTTAPAAEVRSLGEMVDRFGYHRKYVQVAAGLSEDKLVALVRRLHEREPETWFWLLDDDAQAAAMMKALPATTRGDDRGYPATWVQQHTVGHVGLQLRPGEPRRWVLFRGAGSEVIETLVNDGG